MRLTFHHQTDPLPTSGPGLKVLLADDHEVVRRGLMQMLSNEFAGVVFGEATTVAQTLEQMRKEAWDLVLLDINMPGRSGLEVLEAMKTRRHKPPVLILSMSSEDEYAVRAVKQGAAGYLPKAILATELAVAVRKVLEGGLYITPSVGEKLADQAMYPAGTQPHEQLSSRELQVMRLIAIGKNVKEIASDLSLSEKTVFTYRDRVRAKLNVKTDVEVARYALRHRLVQ